MGIYGISLIMGNAGFVSSTAMSPDPVRLWGFMLQGFAEVCEGRMTAGKLCF